MAEDIVTLRVQNVQYVKKYSESVGNYPQETLDFMGRESSLMSTKAIGWTCIKRRLIWVGLKSNGPFNKYLVIRTEPTVNQATYA